MGKSYIRTSIAHKGILVWKSRIVIKCFTGWNSHTEIELRMSKGLFEGKVMILL